jgi:hypothetical protein
MLTKSIDLYRSQLFANWNLARLNNQLGKTNKSKSYYENALKILTFDDYEKIEDIKQIITIEMNN